MATKNKYSLRITERAEKDIDDVFDYIVNELKNPTAFNSLYKKFLSSCENVCLFPHSCPISNLPAPFKVRKIILDNYIAFYEVDSEKEEIIISRFCYARQDLNNIF